jgi:hypothetical protein
MSDSELINWENYPFIPAVDLEYPQHLHDKHSDYPVAPETIVINKVTKVAPNLNDKKNYVIHHVNLKQYLSLGMELTRVHGGIKFEESDFLKKYIDFNTSLRKIA